MRALFTIKHREKKRSYLFLGSVLGTIIVLFLAYLVYPIGIHERKKPLCKDCNIVLITIDTCSARNIPCYGYDRNTTPNLCAFAQKNQLFLNSFANAPWTLPSHASIMTGLLPWKHTVMREWIDSLPQSIPLLPELLQKQGYETILFQDKNSAIMPLDTVYNRGVSEIDEIAKIERIFLHLDKNTQKNKKSFISYYITQCHEPNRVGSANKMYTTDSFPGIPIEPGADIPDFTPGIYEYMKKNLPRELKEGVYGSQTAMAQQVFDKMIKSGSFDKAKSIFYDSNILPDPTIFNAFAWSYIYNTYIDVTNKKMMEYLRALYDQQLFQMDRDVLRHFFTQFQDSPYQKNTIVLISSQHGQEFGEHGVFGHSTLYEGNNRVPFILSVPGVPPRTYETAVEGVDIMPTFLELVGIEHQNIFDGVSLVPLLRRKKIPERLIVAQQDQDVLTLRKGDWKLFVKVHGTTYDPYELYNTKQDPDEQNDVLAAHMDIAKTFIEEYKKNYEDIPL